MSKLTGIAAKYAKNFLDLPLAQTMRHVSPKPHGRTFETPGVRLLPMRKVRVLSKADTDKMRAAFDKPGGPKDKYLADMSSTVSTKELSGIGMKPAEIQNFRNTGILPRQYQVHHRVPLKLGGTNNPDNFIIIRDNPEHKLFTAYQNARVRNADGQDIDIDLPIPPPHVNVWPQPGSHARLQGTP